jgi:exodeoxyribonuclease V alpha subunit
MSDMWLTKQLFSKIKPGAKILLVGDADQLPSVGAGNVFRELIGCGLIPVTVLDEIFRQTKDSLIAHNAKFINEAKTSLYYGNDFVFIKCKTQPEAAAAIQRIYFDEIAKSSVEQVQILSPFRSDGEASAEKLNEVIRERVNPAAEDVAELKVGLRLFRVNDRVMQTKNKGEISNGDVGFIREIRRDASGNDRVLIAFTDDRAVEYGAEDMGTIELAYAMTVHKAMGSEYEAVIIPILSAHTILLYRNLVYTAITRAKRRVFLVGQKDVLFMAIHRTKIDKRNTLLGQRIVLYHKALVKKQQGGQVA